MKLLPVPLFMTLVLLLGCEQQSPPPDQAAIIAKQHAVLPVTPLTGEQVYMVCVGCHNIGKGEPHKVGPNLYGLRGKRAATAEGFTYSDALTKAGEEWLVWEEGALMGFMVDSEAMVPGTWMLFHNTLSGTEVQAVADYILAQGADERD